MAKVLLINPWRFQDEGKADYDPQREWRNGPYSLLLLGTLLKGAGHQVRLADLARDLVGLGGDLSVVLAKLYRDLEDFRPDLIGCSFFSVHFQEVRKLVALLRWKCQKLGIQPLLVAGGIHPSVEPAHTLSELGFDCACAGEGESALLDLAGGADPRSIAGLVWPGQKGPTQRGRGVTKLDDLPFVDWSLCDHAFYAHPTYARFKIRPSSSLDLVMSRGCANRCNFCAYGTQGPLRFHSAEYVAEHIEHLRRYFGVRGVYFHDSSLGNNPGLLAGLCETLLSRGLASRIEWFANMCSHQVDEKLLRLMWRAGCRYLFYGFESGSPRVLKSMNKRGTLEDNLRACELHNRMGFPYNASMIVGYPGEREEDLLLTKEFLARTKPPSIGVNYYVPLPGSADYARLKQQGVIQITDPQTWRQIGEVNPGQVYADLPAARFRELVGQIQHLAYQEIPQQISGAWAQALAQDPLASATEHEEYDLSPARMAGGGLRLDLMPRASAGQGTSQAEQRFDHLLVDLRAKWHEIPAGILGRASSTEVLKIADHELLDRWQSVHDEYTTGPGFAQRGWYHELYMGQVAGKKVLDVGSGFGVDGITMARQGAEVHFVDIVESNLAVLARLCQLMGLNKVHFHHLRELASLRALPGGFDLIWAQGSLINLPVDLARLECGILLSHLKTGGRWVELCYPRERWERDGRMAPEDWGERTDGGAPWMEWYDLDKLLARLAPTRFEVVLAFNFCQDDFNWFDLKKAGSPA